MSRDNHKSNYISIMPSGMVTDYSLDTINPKGKVAIVEAFDYWLLQTDFTPFNLQGTLALFDLDGLLLKTYSLTGKQSDTGQDPLELPLFIEGRVVLASCLSLLIPQSYRRIEPTHKEHPSIYAVPLVSARKEGIGALVLCLEQPSATDGLMLLHSFALSLNSCIQLYIERLQNLALRQSHMQSANEAKKRDMLFQAAKKLHSKNDVDSVLVEITETIKLLYPNVEMDVYLSQDNSSSTIPFRTLNFQNISEDICARAFMEGNVISQYSTESQIACCVFAVPLTGKQGVYGVLHLKLDSDNGFDTTDIQFISMLADTAGNAFENAKLYEQSNLLINELRLINEITKRLNQSLKLNDIFDYASTELMKIFGSEFCCILQLDKDKEHLIVQASNLSPLFQERLSTDYGFAGIVFATKEPLIISDYWNNRSVSSKLMELTDSRSLIASPILVNGEVVGVILVAHRKPNFFSYDNFKLLQALSGHIGLAITNASLHSEVRRMVITDNLTSLYARHYLYEQINFLQKKDFCGSLILVDIDYFKQINDTFGHQIGDKILVHVSHILKSCIRETDIASRWGGEELAIYLPQVTLEQTMRIAERIRVRVMSETNPQVTVSCGVAEWSWDDEKVSVENLFHKADMALYNAKGQGRNQIKIG